MPPAAASLDFRRIFDALPGGYLVVDPDAPRFTIRDASAEYLRLAMMAREALVGRALFEALPATNPANDAPSGVADLRRSLETVLATRAPHAMAVQRYDVRRPDGAWEERWWSPVNVPVLRDDGSLAWILHRVEDITARLRAERIAAEHLRAEEALRRSEERYALAARATSNAIWDWDLVTGGLVWNEGVHEVFGWAPGEVVGDVSWWYDHIHPDDRERVVAGIHAIIDGADGGQAWRDEYRFRRRDGSYASVVDRGYVARDPDGRALRMIGAMADVTPEREASLERERLLEQSRRLQALTAALAGARTIGDVARIVVDEMLAALGARTGALAMIDRATSDLVLAGHIGFPPDAAARIERQPVDSAGPVPLCFRTGAPLWVHARTGPDGFDARFPALVPVWDRLGIESAAYVPLVAAGETVGVISFGFADARTFDEDARGFLLSLGRQAALAVERARLFDAERTARREAEEANRAKSEFLAVMSHELRTPLNAIAGYAELMAMGIRGPVTAAQRDDLHRIQNSQRHLLGLINEVLNYAKLETGAVHFDVGDVRLCDVLAAAEGLIAPQARAKGIALDVAGCPESLAARADGDKVRQILVNLLSNAVKFTDAGGRIDVRAQPEAAHVLVAVRDTGIGIPADRLDDIFEPFVQVRAGLTRTAEGTGLGLAISRDLARAMGGDLTVTSTLGEGSTFTLALPRAGD